MILIGASLLTGASVAVSGSIGFVGLVIPHLSTTPCWTKSSTCITVVIYHWWYFSNVCGFVGSNCYCTTRIANWSYNSDYRCTGICVSSNKRKNWKGQK